MQVSQQEQLAISRALWERDDEAYFAECLKIRNKEQNVVPLVPNVHQQKVNQEIARQRGLKQPIRIIILKERQSGNSTISGAQIYKAVRFRPADAKVIAHDIETTELLFRMHRRFYDCLPPDEQLPTEAYHRKGIIFSPPHGGSITIGTAGTETTGRGGTTMYLHCSEAAYYKNGKEVMASLLNAVPDLPGSMVIIESTANGMGGYFYDLWQKAKSGQSAFVPLFFSWKDFPEYQMAVPDPVFFEASLTSYERQIRAKYELTLEQLYWRRWVIGTKLNGDADLFKQEYPLSDMEAFLTSGRPRFDRECILTWPVQEALCGYLQSNEMYHGRQISFELNKEGWLKIWKRPFKGRNYVIGADVAEGIEVEDAPQDDRYDHSSADVLDADTGEQVAHLHGDFEPDQFGRLLAILGEWYNWAFVGVERNNNGLTTINELEHAGYPQSLIFARTQATEGGRYATPQKGWRTDLVTRANMINSLALSIRENSMIVHSQETQNEFLQFVIKASGRAEAQAGAKDDRVFSLGIALKMIEARPFYKEEEAPDVDVPSEAVSYRPGKYKFRQAGI